MFWPCVLFLAYAALARGLQGAAHGMVVVPARDYQQGGATLAVRSVLRGVPSAILRPMIGAADAIAKASIGAQNSLKGNPQEKSSKVFKQS